MKVAVVGLGKVGHPLATVLSRHGFKVHGIEISRKRVQQLSKIASYKVHDKPGEYLRECEVVFIIVQTPSISSGKFNLEYVENAVKGVIKYLKPDAIITICSTINVGDIEKLRKYWKNIAYTPLMIALGRVEEDLEKPEYVLIGSDDPKITEVLRSVWKKIVGDNVPFIETSTRNMEIIKLTFNFWLPAKISLLNSTAIFCEKYNGDFRVVAEALKHDTRLAGKRWWNEFGAGAGIGFGGPCLAPGTMVQTITGLKPIEEIQVGDLVLTHTGNWRKVTKTYKRWYEGPIVKVKHQGVTIRITPDHPVLGCHRSNGAMEPITWVRMGEVRDSFLFAFPRSKFFDKVSHKEIIIADGYLLTPLRSKNIEIEHYSGFVYNLEVDEDNSYCLETITVHNCFPRDIRNWEAHLPENVLVKAVERINVEMVERSVNLIRSFGKKNVVFLGVTYKAGTNLTIDSQALKILERLRKFNDLNIYVYDPTQPGQFSSAKEAVKMGDIIFIAVPWSEFAELEPHHFREDQIVIDPWRVLVDKKLPCKHYAYGIGWVR